MLNAQTEPVSECHLAGGVQKALRVHNVRAQDPSLFQVFGECAVLPQRRLIIRKVIFIPADPNQHQTAPGLLQLRADDVPQAPCADREGYQCRRNVHPVKGSAHGILPADRGKPKRLLGAVGAEQGAQRLAPALRLFCHPSEILLEAESGLFPVSAGGYDLRHGLEHREGCAVERAPGRQIRIEPVCHQGDGIALASADGKLCRHHLCLRSLVSPPERHQHASGADGGIKHLHQASLRTAVQIRQSPKQDLPDIPVADRTLREETLSFRHHEPYVCLLLRAVSIEKCT